MVKFLTATGFPADCVQLGVHALFDARPDIVVSGINVGYNHGAAYLQSSGTVGAALEGAIAGVPSIAFSMGTAGGDWNTWKLWAESAESIPTWERLAHLATSMVDQMLKSGTSGAVSVGLPDAADSDTDKIATSVHDMVAEVQGYVPGYRLRSEPQFEPDPRNDGGERVVVFVEVEGAADYLPAYSGNLDIMTAAAAKVGDEIAQNL